MDTNTPGGLLRWFSDLQDPRTGQNILHPLSSMLAIAVMAVICGAEGWVEVAAFGRCKVSWLKTFLSLPHGIPSHDTFGRVFSALSPEQFERCFLNWTAHLARGKSKLVAIDGKTLRRSFDRTSSKTPIHMISAWCQQNQLVLGQLATEAKSNEITAIPKLLDLLDLRGAVVSIDAMGCQRQIAQRILDAGADYLLQVKDNQPGLRESIQLLFDEGLQDDNPSARYGYAQDVDGDHGRIETRRCWTTRMVAGLDPEGHWRQLASVACVERIRQSPEGTSCKRHYYISSLSEPNARTILDLIRSHWAIENSLHWCLDVQFNEDSSRIRQGHAAENFSRLRRWALNALKQDKTRKIGLKAKAKSCGWDHDYLLKILTK